MIVHCSSWVPTPCTVEAHSTTAILTIFQCIGKSDARTTTAPIMAQQLSSVVLKRDTIKTVGSTHFQDLASGILSCRYWCWEHAAWSLKLKLKYGVGHNVCSLQCLRSSEFQKLLNPTNAQCEKSRLTILDAICEAYRT